MSSDSSDFSDNEECYIGGYVLLSPIGMGSFSKVMLARHLATGTEVAVKIIHKEDSTEKFQEIASLKSLNHPNITKLFQVIDSLDQTFLFMECVSRGHLLNYLHKNGPMAEGDARPMFRQMVSAVQYCHHKEITHRDLKLENILLDGNNNIKVADFGFSTKFSDDKLQTFCGTLSYMAPEIFQLLPYDGQKVDAWSLGVILYRMVTGKLPFEWINFEEHKRNILNGHVHIPDSLSVECQELLKKLLTVDPSHRTTVEGIMEDQWLNIGYEEALRPYSEPPEGDIDPWVIKKMEKLGYKKEEIEESVSQRKYNDIMGTYMILQNRQNKMMGRTIKVRPCPALDPNFSAQGARVSGQKWGKSSSLPCYVEARVSTPPPFMERRTSSLTPTLERRMFISSPSPKVWMFIPLSSLETRRTTDTESMKARAPSPPSHVETRTSSLSVSLETRILIPSLSLKMRMTTATDSRESSLQDNLNSMMSIPLTSLGSRVTSSPPRPRSRPTIPIAHSDSSCIQVAELDGGTPASPSGPSHGRKGVARRVLRFFLKCFCCWPSTNKQHHKRKRVKPI